MFPSLLVMVAFQGAYQILVNLTSGGSQQLGGSNIYQPVLVWTYHDCAIMEVWFQIPLHVLEHVSSFLTRTVRLKFSARYTAVCQMWSHCRHNLHDYIWLS